MKFAVLLLALWASAGIAAESPRFASLDGVFTDTARSRDVPYRIYYPQPLTGRCPVVVVSHGLGGSRENNAMLGVQLASSGYIAVHVQHAGSDQSVYAGKGDPRTAREAAIHERQVAIDRFRDVPFAVSQLGRLNEQDGVLKEHLDLQALGMAGHSYGAISTMVAAGERIGQIYASFKVPTLRAAVLLSPSPPNEGQDVARAYKDIAVPLFHVTGTKDSFTSTDRKVTPKERLEPYANLNIADQYLLVLDGAEHLTFSGGRIGTSQEKPKDKEHMTAVLTGATYFFNAYLKHDDAAKKWLQTEFRQKLQKKDRFEFK